MDRKNQIRQIAIGPDYKNAMYYKIGQSVYGGHTITDIIETDEGYEIHIMTEDEQEGKRWKFFNKSMAVSTEYDLEY